MGKCTAYEHATATVAAKSHGKFNGNVTGELLRKMRSDALKAGNANDAARIATAQLRLKDAKRLAKTGRTREAKTLYANVNGIVKSLRGSGKLGSTFPRLEDISGSPRMSKSTGRMHVPVEKRTIAEHELNAAAVTALAEWEHSDELSPEKRRDTDSSKKAKEFWQIKSPLSNGSSVRVIPPKK